MNEELLLAVEELRLRSADRTWFIPARLNECLIPDLEIGPGQTLRDIQWVDLFPNQEDGIERIYESINPDSNFFKQFYIDAYNDLINKMRYRPGQRP